ncbi:hypothetical protein BJY00DRAFT_318290 [Aspergillus carlsbadensis]|nr:hypothetical protein BJY00DRAFT_318290 [Aspergillus carlsbadensis]
MVSTTFAEVSDPHRVELVRKLGKMTEGVTVDAAFWAFVWLADVNKIEADANVLTAANRYVRQGYPKMPKAANTLKLWSARGSIANDDPTAGADRKRKAKESSFKESPAKSVRQDELLTDETTIAMGMEPRGRSSARRQSQSPSKIPRPHPSISKTATTTPSTPVTTSTPTISRVRNPANGRAGKLTYPSIHICVSAAIAKKIQCKLRDARSCLITHGGDIPQVAHIYPFAIGRRVGTSGHQDFWNVLRDLWTEEKISLWQRDVMGDEGTETLLNLMCMDPTVHGLWGMARFALRPLELSSDKKRLTVEFHWLPALKYEERRLTIPPASPTNTNSAPGGTRLYDCATDKRIQTGDVLTFTTSDPIKLPLPSIALLDMQWNLNRLTALSGAADVSDEELDSDDELGLAPPIFVEEDVDIGPLQE